VPVRAPTRAICAALGVDPLRLISSGALLVAGPDGAGLVEGLAAGGIAAVEIGVLTADPGERMLLHADGHAERVRGLDRDELYRLAEERAARGG
jgi:hydrogenase maturation factor